MRIQAWAMRHASAIVANSEYTAQQVTQAVGPCGHVRIVKPPIPTSGASPREPDRGRLLFAGRLVPVKGCAHAIRVVEAIPHATLAIAGDGPERVALQDLARSLGVKDRVSFLGWLDRSALDEEMQKAEVVLFPSFWPETFGQIGPQAAMNSRPVVAYSVGGVSSWLANDTGALVAAGDLRALVRATRELLHDPGRARLLGRRARKAAEAFGPEPFADNLALTLEYALRAGVRTSMAGCREGPGERPRSS
jgi:glycosyltransferase involved in cell wall biosynthesis